MTDWIPVTERLPWAHDFYWAAVRLDSPPAATCYLYFDGRWRHKMDMTLVLEPVLAWQPITKPEPYKP